MSLTHNVTGTEFQRHGPATEKLRNFTQNCVLAVTVDQLFMHHFHNFSSASGGFWRLCPQTPLGFHPWIPLGDFRLQTP